MNAKQAGRKRNAVDYIALCSPTSLYECKINRQKHVMKSITELSSLSQVSKTLIRAEEGVITSIIQLCDLPQAFRTATIAEEHVQ
jgi:hypothetical protein